MRHISFEEIEDLQVCVRAHTPAVDAEFAWNEEDGE